MEVLECVLRKSGQKFNFLAFRKGIALRIISRSIDILRVCPGVSRCTRLRKCVQKINFLALRKGIAHRINLRSIDILRVCPGVSR